MSIYHSPWLHQISSKNQALIIEETYSSILYIKIYLMYFFYMTEGVMHQALSQIYFSASTGCIGLYMHHKFA